MKRFIFGTIVFFGLAGAGPPARAVPFDFTFTGSLVTFTVPTTAMYQILAFGAEGASGNFAGTIGPGGRGAEIGGDFSLTAGEVLQIAVGGAGADSFPGRGASGGAGGGGSFVVGLGDTPLVIAGGGGGGGAMFGTPLSGEGGLTVPNGIGNGGAAGFGLGGGGGGGGFLTAGEDAIGGAGGRPFPDLAGGFFGGGFGGGGGAAGGAGGGGGYSGGNGGGRGGLGVQPGGGGGSFDAGTNQILVADFRAGDGEVIITELPIAAPEPASLVLLGAALASLAMARRTASTGNRR